MITSLVTKVRPDYLSRVVEAELLGALGDQAAVVVEGAKGVGKTETASRLAGSWVLFDIDQDARSAAAIDPALVLAGESPRLLDEWQEVPAIRDHVRRAVDAREGPFILTGSAVQTDDVARHTGAARFHRLRMRPMSLFELGRSSGALSLGTLLAGEPVVVAADEVGIPDLAEVLCVGGWPALLGRGAGQAQRFLHDYLDSVARIDIRRVDRVSRNPVKVWAVLRSLARNVATKASLATIARDAGGPDASVEEETARAYLTSLDRLMVVEDQPAWAPRLRSRARVRSAPKRHFCDPSLAAAALRASPARLLRDLNLLGLLFESLVVRDVRVYAQYHGAKVFHYRDNIGEIDAVIDDGDRWGAIEVRLGIAHVEEAAVNLKRFAERIDTEKSGSPAFLGVVVPTRLGYTRQDGIHVIPVQSLGP